MDNVKTYYCPTCKKSWKEVRRGEGSKDIIPITEKGLIAQQCNQCYYKEVDPKNEMHMTLPTNLLRGNTKKGEKHGNK